MNEQMTNDYLQGYATCFYDILADVAKVVSYWEAKAAEKAAVVKDAVTYSQGYRDEAAGAERAAQLSANALRAFRKALEVKAGLQVTSLATGIHAEAENVPVASGGGGGGQWTT